MKYNAFISYSHYSDSNLAPALEKGLQQFAKKLFQRRALHVFRDSNDLSASPDLWKHIEQGLLDSEYFIFLASPRAAESVWCRKEVDFWAAHKSFDQFLIILTHGVLEWDHTTNDFDWNTTTAIPRNVSGKFIGTPLYVDMREVDRDRGLTLKDPEFRTKLIMLAATLHGRSVGDMAGEEVRQHRRTLRIRNGVIITLSILLIAALTLAGYAFQQQQKAEYQIRVALAGNYLSASKATAALDPKLALKLAVYGYEYAKKHGMNLDDISDQLVVTFNNTSHFYKHTDTLFSERSKLLTNKNLSINQPDSLWTENNDSGEFLLKIKDSLRNIRTLVKNMWPITAYHSFPNSDFVSFDYQSHEGTRSIVHHRVLLNTLTNHKTDVFTRGASVTPEYRLLTEISKNGKRAVVTAFSETTLFDAVNYGETLLPLASNKMVTALAVNSTGSRVALGDPNGCIELYEISEYGLYSIRRYELLGHRLEAIENLRFSKDGTQLFSESKTFRRAWSSGGSGTYLELENNPSFHPGHMADTVTRDGQWTIHNIDKIPVLLTTHTKDTIEFEPDAFYTIETNNTAANTTTNPLVTTTSTRYYANYKGLFNVRNERMIDAEIVKDANAMEMYVLGFSVDDRYLFFENKIYYLDPETILRKIRSTSFFGTLEPFSSDEKERYLITDIIQ